MTDAHYHRGGGTFLSVRSCEYAFAGVHPWQADAFDAGSLRARLAAEPALGVGEIGLDRLRTKTIPEVQRAAFLSQLELAAEFRRPVVLHGAKCWGEVVKACRPFAGEIPAFLSHGFSRSEGLLPDIVALNGFVSVGKAVLNDHAVNYRELVKKIPRDRLLAETDCEPDAGDDAQAPGIAEVAAKIGELTGVGESALADNAGEFVRSLSGGAGKAEK
jgi:TatD DNase family protein